MPLLTLDQSRKLVKIAPFELGNELVFAFFDRQPESERDALMLRAMQIGVMALMQDRLSAFLAKTKNELGCELETLKIMFDMQSELFTKSAIKGTLAEDDLAVVLAAFCERRGLADKIRNTGNIAGVLPRNKTGDLVADLADSGKRVVIEAKFDKSVRLGDLSGRDRFVRKTDSSWNQLLESKVNRDAQAALIVFDRALCDASILAFTETVGYLPEAGFICVIDSQKGDFSAMLTGYCLARDIAINSRPIELDQRLLAALVRRLVSDCQSIGNVRRLVEANIKNSLDTLKEMNKALMVVEFSQKFLLRFLDQGTLTAAELLEYYNGDDIRESYKQVEKEILSLATVASDSDCVAAAA